MNVHLPRWAVPFTKPAKYKCAYGGRGSSKTWTFAHLLVARAMREPGLKVACIREFQKSINDSAKPAIEQAIRRMGLGRSFRINRQDIVCYNGSRFFFQGMERNRESIRGWEGVNVCWVEEAQRLTSPTALLLIPTIRAKGSELWFSWNPENRTDWVWQRFLNRPRPTDIIARVNWRDNPWFPAGLNEERVADQRDFPELYPHVWEGMPNDEGADLRVLEYKRVDQAVEAYRMGLAEEVKFAGYVEVGFDVAHMGANKNALVRRRGPVVEKVVSWRGTRHGPTARRTHHLAQEWLADALYYDSTGVGTGPGDILRETADKGYHLRPEMFGGKVRSPKRRYNSKFNNEQFFGRRAAQLGWSVKLRAINTEKLVDHVRRVFDFPDDMTAEDMRKRMRRDGLDAQRVLGDPELPVRPEDCLFINPGVERREEYLSELAQPKYEISKAGKIEIMKLEEGEPSPDLYDATVLAFSRDSYKGLNSRGTTH